ncbi:MAG TPA: hypothetical protein VN934_10935 [Candidatus Tumulicola sp.]|nr:hypothetical protein [Candidatus Tumulicola sp.]
MLAASPGAAHTVRTAVTLNGDSVDLYAGHLTLAAEGHAYLDDDTLHVWADRIVLDLRNDHYVAIGNVKVRGRQDFSGDVLGVDIDSRTGVLVGVDPEPTIRSIAGGDIGAQTAPASTVSEPLALPDLGGEAPYVVATHAVAHLGGDVRLTNARVLVPSARAVFLPSYVYTYSSDPGYVVSNVAGSGEDVPIFIGSTRDSILGLHFMYNPVTKVGIGIDEHIISGRKGYSLISAAPLIGPTHTINYTWQEQVNDHTSSTFTSSTFTSFGTVNNYDLRDSVHRSYFELSATGEPQFLAGRFAWQGFDEAAGSRGLLSDLRFHLRTEYGIDHTSPQAPFAPFPPSAVIPQTVSHVGAELYAAAVPWQIGSRSTLNLSADVRGTRDTLPHEQIIETFSASLTRHWNRYVTTSLSDSVLPIRDFYPSQTTTFVTNTAVQSLGVNYSNANAFSLFVVLSHATGSTTAPSTLIIQPWFASADVRFRLTPSLALELSRSYSFGFEGQRFGSLGFQIFP